MASGWDAHQPQSQEQSKMAAVGVHTYQCTMFSYMAKEQEKPEELPTEPQEWTLDWLDEVNEAAGEIELRMKDVGECFAETPMGVASDPRCLHAFKATSERFLLLAGRLSNFYEIVNCLYCQNDVNVALDDAASGEQEQPEADQQN